MKKRITNLIPIEAPQCRVIKAGKANYFQLKSDILNYRFGF